MTPEERAAIWDLARSRYALVIEPEEMRSDAATLRALEARRVALDVRVEAPEPVKKPKKKNATPSMFA